MNLDIAPCSNIITLMKPDIDLDMAPSMHIIVDMKPVYIP